MHALNSKLFAAEMERVARVVDTYLQTGVCILEADHTDKVSTISPSNCLRRFVRDIAKEQKRPFIWAHCTSYHPWGTGVNGSYGRDRSVKHTTPIALTMPRLQSLHQIYSALLLVASKVDNAGTLAWHYAEGRHNNLHLWYGETKTTFTFYFGGPAIEVFENFVERCRTDKAWRLKLKIPS